MIHFVSATVEGKCVCGRDAAHKLGEEITYDEPCMTCGQTWKFRLAGGDHDDKDDTACENTVYHLGGGPNRHNLTSYVCCFHWSLILGPATGCPLDDNDKTALIEFRRACIEDGNIFAETVELRCVACRGPLKVEGSNPANAMIGCAACGLGHHVANKGNDGRSTD